MHHYPCLPRSDDSVWLGFKGLPSASTPDGRRCRPRYLFPYVHRRLRSGYRGMTWEKDKDVLLKGGWMGRVVASEIATTRERLRPLTGSAVSPRLACVNSLKCFGLVLMVIAPTARGSDPSPPRAIFTNLSRPAPPPPHLGFSTARRPDFGAALTGRSSGWCGQKLTYPGDNYQIWVRHLLPITGSCMQRKSQPVFFTGRDRAEETLSVFWRVLMYTFH